MFLFQTAGLFILTALAEIVGCFLPYLWLRKDGSIWLLVPAALSLIAFVWLLTLHPPPADGSMPPMAVYTWQRPSSGSRSWTARSSPSSTGLEPESPYSVWRLSSLAGPRRSKTNGSIPPNQVFLLPPPPVRLE